MKQSLRIWTAGVLLVTLIMLGALTFTATRARRRPIGRWLSFKTRCREVTAALAQPLNAINDVEWARIHSGTLDGVFYSDLYWGGIRRSSPTLVDIDGDGDPDLLVYGWNRLSGDHDELHFFRNDGPGHSPLDARDGELLWAIQASGPLCGPGWRRRP